MDFACWCTYKVILASHFKILSRSRFQNFFHYLLIKKFEVLLGKKFQIQTKPIQKRKSCSTFHDINEQKVLQPTVFSSILCLYIVLFFFLNFVFFVIQYLNSGAGCIAGAFVHRKHHQNDRPRLCGWWSNREETRFDMQHGVDAAPGADAYRLCNPPPALVALHKAGLEVFKHCAFKKKSEH